MNNLIHGPPPEGTTELRKALGQSPILDQLGSPTLGKTDASRYKLDEQLEKETPCGGSLDNLYQLGSGLSGTKAKPGKSLVNDGTGSGEMIWVGTDDEDESSDLDGSQDEFYIGEEDFDFDGLPSFYSPSKPASYGLHLIASVFHEKRGYLQEWDLELELIRVIMETEPPEGTDYNDALDGGYSFWRWRGWIICLGVVKAYND